MLIACPDQKGLVHAVTGFIIANNGNIVYLEQHVDNSEQMFFMRVEWDLTDFSITDSDIDPQFGSAVGQPFNMSWSIQFSSNVQRMAIFVSRYSHCLFDILSRYQSGEWKVAIPLVISNHNDLEVPVTNLGIEFRHLPITKNNSTEQQQLVLLKQHHINFIVLARYMQILSADFVQHYPHKIINIHHSFLPAFPGARPYHSAYERGVKIIGATSHYVTSDLDAGPIIDQDVGRVRHTDNIDDLIMKGQDIEKIVLARAIWKHLHYKTLIHKNRTLIFD